jgi:hypothetical protein
MHIQNRTAFATYLSILVSASHAKICATVFERCLPKVSNPNILMLDIEFS